MKKKAILQILGNWNNFFFIVVSLYVISCRQSHDLSNHYFSVFNYKLPLNYNELKKNGFENITFSLRDVNDTFPSLTTKIGDTAVIFYVHPRLKIRDVHSHIEEADSDLFVSQFVMIKMFDSLTTILKDFNEQGFEVLYSDDKEFCVLKYYLNNRVYICKLKNNYFLMDTYFTTNKPVPFKERN